MTLGYFITGTDTDVGKTLVSSALLLHLRTHHARVAGMKPVAAGITPGHQDNDDVLALRAAGSVTVPRELDNPYNLSRPMSPHLAARAEGVTIDIALLAVRYQQLAALADAVVVEGAGGFFVPLNDHHTGADLAQAIGLPVLMVVGLRLGCLNHALLTQDAIRARGLRLAGWVANRIDPDMASPEDNIESLRQRLHAPMWADIPRLATPDPALVRWLPAATEPVTARWPR
ncbi:MAG: hypothetical protein RLZZ618_4278 [Pseudomonadota bacterium]|jgi:dethiobiotin synthetase